MTTDYYSPLCFLDTGGKKISRLNGLGAFWAASCISRNKLYVKRNKRAALEPLNDVVYENFNSQNINSKLINIRLFNRQRELAQFRKIFWRYEIYTLGCWCEIAGLAVPLYLRMIILLFTLRFEQFDRRHVCATNQRNRQYQWWSIAGLGIQTTN